MSDHRALIEEGQTHKAAYGQEWGPSNICASCGRRWPCLTARLADALAKAEEQASVAERASNAWEANAQVYAQNAEAAERRVAALEHEVGSRSDAAGHPGIPTGPGTIAAGLTDPSTHGKALARNDDGTYRTVGRARQRKPRAALSARRDGGGAS